MEFAGGRKTSHHMEGLANMKNLRASLVAFLVSLMVAILGYGAFLYWQERQQGAVTPTLSKLNTFSQWEQQGIDDIEDLNKPSLFKHKYPVIILHFWASWCGPCVDELPSLVKLSKKYSQQVLIFAYSQDRDEDAMKNFLQQHNLASSANLQFIFDEKPLIASRFFVDKLPESFVFTQRDRKLQKRLSGSIEWVTPESDAFFQSLLTQPSPSE